MKRAGMPLMAVLAAVIAGGCGSGGPAADYVVSISGSDDGAGTVEEPFLTIEQARNAIRMDIERGLGHDITILIRGGSYLRHKTLWFGPDDSGTADHTITYAAWPGETVRLVGGVTVTGWERLDGGIWSAPIPDGVLPVLEIAPEDGETREGSALLGAGMRTMQLTEDGVPLTLACCPETGELPAELMEGPTGVRVVVMPNSIDIAAISPANTSVAVSAAPGWYTQIMPVAAYSADSGWIDFAMETIETGGDCRIVVRNVLACLDRPGEYYVDRPGRRVYVRPRTGDASDHEYIASAAGSIIAIDGDGPDGPVRNLHFRGLDLSLASGDMIVMTGAENCSVRECLIEYGYESGITLRGHTTGITIADNLIRHTGSYGILMEGGHTGANGANVVENNRIHDCGELYGHGAGIMLFLSGGNTIAHNELYNLARSGIAIGSIPLRPAWNSSVDALPVPPSNRLPGNRIVSNRIEGAMVGSGDGGAIDCRMAGDGTVIDRNLITGTGTDAYSHLAGIRIDGSEGISVTRNIVNGLDGSGRLIAAYGSGGRIANNILIYPESGTDECLIATGGVSGDSVRFVRNIVAFAGTGGIAYDFTGMGAEAAADSNLYCKPAGGPFWPPEAGIATFDEWRSGNTGGYDRHSIAADPADNWDLDAASPAHTLGFEPVDTGDIGLTDSFPARFGER